MMKTNLILLTSLSLLLAACGQSGTATTQPSTPVASSPATTTQPVAQPARTGTLYEVTFQGANGDQISASAQSVGGLNAQALQNSQDTLQFDSLATETFVTGGVRHVKATFKVTNKSTRTLSGLSLIPVDTDDADSDPSNNTTQPTVGTTPFTRVSYFDGSDASAKASSITPTGGKRFNASTGAAESDPNASTFLSNQDVSKLSASAPTGLVIAGIKNYGWKVSDSLAVNASANVTFAVDLPADADPKNDPFRFSLVFTNAVAGPTAIHDVQGSTPNGNAVSPLNGKTVTVQGVVTAVSQGKFGTGGFYIEAPDADQDSDASTSEGLYVACDASCYAPKVGDLVSVNGTVSEINTQTVLTAATSGVTLDGTAALPTPVSVTLPLSSAGALEAYEGMRVRVTGVVSNNYTLGRFNTLTVADSRPYSYTQKNSPSVSGYAAYIADLQKRTVLVDDLNIGNNPPTNFGDNNQPLSASNTLRTGDIADVTGVVSYGWAGGTVSLDSKTDALGYRVLTTQADATFTGPRPSAPVVSGNLTVAGANVLNFFTTLNGSAANSCTSNGNDSSASLKARGANTCAEYTRQLDKVVSNLAGLNADVTGLMEVQNDTTVGSQGNDYSLVTLVSALNTRLGGDVYGIVNNPNPGTDAIRVAMIYKKANVTPVGTALNDTNSINSRIPLAQVFQAAGGSRFAVVVNHLKSKSSGTGTGNSDIFDGQGGSAAMREQQVVRLLDLIQNRIVAPTSAGGLGIANVIAVGDFNAYDQEPSLVNLRKGQDGVAGNADDLSDVFGSDVYSYQFDGQFGSLDHAFVTQSMKGLLSGGEKWHDNSDEPVVLDYNSEFKSTSQVGSYYDSSAYRSSDHDPLKVGFNLPSLGTLSVSPSGNASATINQPYTLTTSTSGNPDSMSIDWGDGTSDNALPGTTTSRTHTYTSTGAKAVVVTVTRGSETATGTQNVTVNPAPTATVSLSNSGDLSFTAGATSGNTDTITVTAANGSAAVQLSATVAAKTGSAVSGTLPTVSLSPTNVSGSTGGSSIATVTTAADTKGTYTVTVTGSGDASATTSFDVTVNAPASGGMGNLVISQVYGGGGATTGSAAYNADYVELFNAGGTAVSLNGLSLQYGSATGTSTANFSGILKLPAVSIPASSYYLVQVSAAGSIGASVPSPDFTATSTSGTLSMSATSGKIALVTGVAATSSAATNTALIDLVGYGTASSYEGSAAAPVLSTSLADFRKLSGCQDTNQNGSDFATGTPASRNSASPANTCAVP